MLAAHFRAFGRVYLALANRVSSLEKDEAAFSYFSLHDVLPYHSFCDDFGPMNLASIHQFCTMLDENIQASQGKLIGLVTDCEGSSVTNAVFLLGAYMILKFKEEPSTLKEHFRHFPEVLPYRDISPGKQNFELNLEDCWEALAKACTLRWFELGSNGFDAQKYLHFDDPRNADLHVIVPNKIIAMKGPITLPDGAWHDTQEMSRNFSPSHYADILRDFHVGLVVRLNQPLYEMQEFEKHGIAVVDLFFEDCTLPPNDVVVKFLLILENLPGAAAVHCKAGLGRTGTLIALYLMKNFSFTSRQAIAWLRIVRPGSVIGRQQQYLCEMEGSMERLRYHPLSGRFATGGSTPAGDCVRNIATVREMVARMLALVQEDEQRRLRKARALTNRTTPSISHTSHSKAWNSTGRNNCNEGEWAGSAQWLASHVSGAAMRRGAQRFPPSSEGGASLRRCWSAEATVSRIPCSSDPQPQQALSGAGLQRSKSDTGLACRQSSTTEEFESR